MELSPKQQSVELIKKANRLLVLGHKNPSADFVGSALAIKRALLSLGKTVDVVASDPIPDIYQFLPNVSEVDQKFSAEKGKILRVNTKKVPVKSVKFRKEEEHLDFILEADKNLKFEYLDIINTDSKPDLIIVLDTADVEKIDKIYDANTELFFEVPVINIDHHAGNEYFGTVNLVDLTATSTAEILVALFEALGIKVSDPDTATLLLFAIISQTGSFRSQNTTPKSLTVAAQLLAAGGRQQEIINNLYRKRPMALMKIWGEMLADIKLDANHEFAWTKVKLSEDSAVTVDDVMESADELLSGSPETKIILILTQKGKGSVYGKFKAKKGTDVTPLAKLFEGDGVPSNATFELAGLKLGDAELTVLKTLADYWGEASTEKELWDIMGKAEEAEIEREMTATPKMSDLSDTKNDDKSAAIPKNQEHQKIEAAKVEPKKQKRLSDEDVIDAALHSIEKEEEITERRKEKKVGNFSSVGDVLYSRHHYGKPKMTEPDIDVFDEETE